MRAIVWLLVLGSLAALSPIRAAPRSAAQFVEHLYLPYSTDNFPYYLGKEARNIFAPPLLAEIEADQQAAHGEVGHLDEDPFCGCQDPGGFRLLKIETKSVSARKAIVSVTFDLGTDTYTPVRRVIVLDLVAESRAWQVADIHGKEMPSLRAFLRVP